jgi:hypothetical protein
MTGNDSNETVNFHILEVYTGIRRNLFNLGGLFGVSYPVSL